MKICRASRKVEKGTTSSSYNQGRRIGSRKDSEQATSQREGQVLGKVEGIYSRVQYLERKKELGKCKGGN